MLHRTPDENWHLKDQVGQEGAHFCLWSALPYPDPYVKRNKYSSALVKHQPLLLRVCKRWGHKTLRGALRECRRTCLAAQLRRFKSSRFGRLAT